MLSPKDLRLDVPAFATLNADRGAAQLGPFASLPTGRLLRHDTFSNWALFSRPICSPAGSV